MRKFGILLMLMCFAMFITVSQSQGSNVHKQSKTEGLYKFTQGSSDVTVYIINALTKNYEVYSIKFADVKQTSLMQSTVNIIWLNVDIAYNIKTCNFSNNLTNIYKNHFVNNIMFGNWFNRWL